MTEAQLVGAVGSYGFLLLVSFSRFVFSQKAGIFNSLTEGEIKLKLLFFFSLPTRQCRLLKVVFLLISVNK